VPRILLLDNHDSFTWNVAHALGMAGAGVVVRASDSVTLADLTAMDPDAIVVSPGPGTPAEAGISVDVIGCWAARVPMLGVCLGHQAIGVAFGGRVRRAARLMHGKTSVIHHDGRGLFAGLPNPFPAMRYNSLVLDPATLPTCFWRSAWTDDGEVMAVRHRVHAIDGVQFHPESILTPAGGALMAAFVAQVAARASRRAS
jgi:anthranilate synthase/aminodeoxychorismate synthase-like glutamine amidotransferase